MTGLNIAHISRPSRSIGEGERATRRWYYMFIFVNFSKFNPKSNVESPFHFGCFGILLP